MPTREEMHSLGQEITGSYEARTAGVAQIRNETRTQLGEFHSARHAMSRQQRADLRRRHTGLRTGVSAQLKGYDEAGHAMSRQQRADLRRRHTGLMTSVSAQMQELATEHAGAREEWQKMATTVQAKRAGATAVAEAPAPATVPAQKAPAEEAQEEELGNGDLVNQVFAYLAEHPDGTRLAELEEEFVMGRFEMARTIKRLTDYGKVEKRDLLYFAI